MNKSQNCKNAAFKRVVVSCIWQLLFRRRAILNSRQNSHGVTKDQDDLLMGHLPVSSSAAPQKAVPPSCQTIRWQEESRHLHLTKDNQLIALKSLPTELLKCEDEANVADFTSGRKLCLNVRFWFLYHGRNLCMKNIHKLKKEQKLVNLTNLLGIPVRRSPLLFCLFSKGMSEGALSPLLIHLLPLVYVTDGDLGPHHLWSTSTPSDSPANLCLFVC